MSKYPSGISYDEFYAALDAYCDAMIRAALDEAANEIDCGKCYGKPCPRPGDCMNVLADEIRALKTNPQALAAIKAKAEGWG
jgi:hypothetical protein